jgi:hypothetical protein
MPARSGEVVREGLIAGLIGATAVALWFFIVDMMNGRFLYTPVVLGRTVMSVLGPVEAPDSTNAVTLVYTIAHYAVFCAIGIVVTWLVHRSEDTPSLLAGFLILFAAFELGSFGLIALLAQGSAFGQLAWLQIGLANLLAFGLMGYYIYRRHPALRTRIDSVLGGRGE